MDNLTNAELLALIGEQQVALARMSKTIARLQSELEGAKTTTVTVETDGG